MSDAGIILTYSKHTGFMAFAHGENHEIAEAVLAEAGFVRNDSGLRQLPTVDPEAGRAALAHLAQCAEERDVALTSSRRGYIGDIARDIARRLPGRWNAAVERYPRQAWQEDIVPWLWDSGDLASAARNERIPYAAVLANADTDTSLLLVEHPGRTLSYLVGAFAPDIIGGCGDSEPDAPRSIVLAPSADRAAHAITQKYLPAYDHAVHSRRLSIIRQALDIIRGQHDTWTAVAGTPWEGDVTPLGADAFGARTADFLDTAWRQFLDVLDHAPALLDQCHPSDTPSPQDADVLDDLAAALIDAERAREHGTGGLSRAEHNRQVWPAIETWLTHADVFLGQARAAAPPSPAAAPSAALPRALPAGQPAPRR
ncbi:hypothetical protein [Streptomyces sp. NPDC058683]|uniref:hypothetical protein n=1 Tax=Streptomyces sp. NPDC058683 TaxID=3346597 RepID=UPI00365CF38F